VLDPLGLRRNSVLRMAAHPKRKLAAVALANKTARIAWEMLAKDEDYRAPAAVLQAAWRLQQAKIGARYRRARSREGVMTNCRGDRTRDTPYRHRGFHHVGMIGARASRTSSGPAAMQRPHKQAVYMTAPETPVVTTSKSLPTGGRPYATGGEMVSDPEGLTPWLRATMRRPRVYFWQAPAADGILSARRAGRLSI
jgi:hypothetical protein